MDENEHSGAVAQCVAVRHERRAQTRQPCRWPWLRARVRLARCDAEDVTIFWNDVEILRTLDAAERGEASPISNGLALVRTTAARMAQSLGEANYISFLRELFVLAGADLIT